MRHALVLAVALGLALGACGKKGDPLTPSEAAARQAEKPAAPAERQKQN